MADDFMSAIYKGALARESQDRIQSRNRMAPDIEPALQGDQGALARVFQQNPDAGLRIAHIVGQMDANKRKAAAEYTDFITRDGMGILTAPAAQRPQLYAQTLELARARGYDVSTMPPTYGPDAESKLKFYVQRATPFARYFKGQGAGGPAAPAGGGWGGPPAPRTSAAPMPTDGPMVAVADTGGPAMSDAGDQQPPASPQINSPGAPVLRAPAGAPAAVAGAGPMPMAVPPTAPPIAPTAGPASQPPQPQPTFAAPPGPMAARLDAQPAGPAPAPTQTAGLPAPRDDSGEGDFVGGADAERAFRLSPGESIKLEPKTGKPIVDGGGVWVQARDGSVEWRLLDPQGRPIRVQQVDLGDRVQIMGSGGEILREIPKGRSPNSPTRVQTVDLGDRIGVLGPDGEVVREVPKGRQPRPVDNAGRDDLTKVGTPALEMSALLRDFKDDYGGYRLGAIGDFDNARRRNFGDDTGQAQWWQRYNAAANEVRHSLFGSALTATEKTAFDAAMITPGMDPGEIKKNLGRQRAVMLRAAARTAGGMIKGGANQDEVEHYLGLHIKDLPGAFDDVPTSPPAGGGPAAAPASGAPPASGGGPKRLRFNPATGELE